MLNAYGRVDKGKLIALDRDDNKRTSFGPTIGETFYHFQRIQNLLQNYSMGDAKSRNETDDYRHQKSDAKALQEINSTSSGNFGDKSNSSRRSNKNKPTESRTDDNSVQVVDTLLSNLLINSVLSALRAGNQCANNHIRIYVHLVLR